MKPIELTPTQRDVRAIQLQRRIKRIGLLFALACLLPVVFFLLFQFGVFTTRPASVFTSWEEATVLVITPNSRGTGFLISPTKVLTARHVVESLASGESVQVSFDRLAGKPMMKASLLWKDQTIYPPDAIDYFLTDLAVLELGSPEQVEFVLPLEIGVSAGIGPLTQVVAIGYPNGDFSVTEGTINNESFDGRELFKLDAAINSGNSGGPLICKEDGTVIGMLVGQRSGTIQGENVANKIDNIVSLMESNGIDIYQ